MSQIVKHRVRCAGIFIQDEKILLVKHRKQILEKMREYYLLPGGGQEPSEDLVATLKREWKEELKLEIAVGDFLFCGESFSLEENPLKQRHILQMVFAVQNIKGEIKVQPDGTLFDFAWIPLSQISQIDLFPDCVSQILQVSNPKSRLDKYIHYVWKN